VFAAVLVADLLLVWRAGTDIPLHDQWNIEGAWLYPAWIDGTLRLPDLFRTFNEHRIVWTHLLNLALFSANGQWDPLVQMVAIGVMRSACAAVLVWQFGKSFGSAGRIGFGLLVIMAFLPHLAWHTMLWGIESHTYFAIGFSWTAFALCSGTQRSFWRTGFGLLSGVAAEIAMAPGELVPVVLLALRLLRWLETRRVETLWRTDMPLLVLLAVAFALHTEGNGALDWHPANLGAFLFAAGRALGWPHVGSPFAAIALNLPLVIAVVLRISRRRTAAAGEDFVLLVGGWSAAIALATAWARGGGPELAVGIPSRYVDFLVGLPLANAWMVMVLSDEAASCWKVRARAAAIVWCAFVIIGWMGLSAEVMTRLILPRARDRDAPVRLAREFQLSGDVGVFAGQPRLYIPHPHLSTVHAVLTDPRMQGHLPPSLQPERGLGPLSKAVRSIFR